MALRAEMYGYPCPECGKWTGEAREAGRDVEGRRVRRRSCTSCGLTFATLEVVSPLSLHKLALSPHPRRLTVTVVEAAS